MRSTYIIVAGLIGLFIGTVLGAAVDGPAYRLFRSIYPASRSATLADRHYELMTIFHRRMAGNIPPGSVLFVGDSITQGLCVSAVCERAVNLGIGNDTSVGVEGRLNGFEALPRAAVVVVAIGVNDLKTRTPAEVEPDYARLLAIIPDSVKVVWSSVLPVDEHKAIYKGWNERIIDLNARAARLCAARPGCSYLDAFSPLGGISGLPPRYHTGDGIHLNTAGYEVWIDTLRNAIDSTLSERENP